MIKVSDKYVFFDRDCILSSNYPAPFKYKYGSEFIEFTCPEQAFQWSKAIYFNDYKTSLEIRNEKDTTKYKELGRKVKPYRNCVWTQIRLQYMYLYTYIKFSQNPDLKTQILTKLYDSKGFVDCTIDDRNWGIRLSIDNDLDELNNERKWRGGNLMGRALNKARESLISGKLSFNHM